MLRHLWLSAPNRLWSLTVIRAGQNGGVTGNTPIRLTLRNSPTILVLIDTCTTIRDGSRVFKRRAIMLLANTEGTKYEEISQYMLK